MSHLQNSQYGDSSNFNARLYLHYAFSGNTYPWPRWVFDRFRKDEYLTVLELGCGNGYLWRLNADRIPRGWNIALSDFSEGMLEAARSGIGNSIAGLSYEVIDAGTIPRDDGSLDMVIANHMLYHVPDRKKAFSEIRRVLGRDGVFYATTMRDGYMNEMRRIIRDFTAKPAAGERPNPIIKNFSIENGGAQLSGYFGRVTLELYENTLRVTQAGPFVDYAYSLQGMHGEKSVLEEHRRDEFLHFIEREIAERGTIHIPSDSGMFTCRQA